MNSRNIDLSKNQVFPQQFTGYQKILEQQIKFANNELPVRVQKSSRTQIRLGIPPVAGARCATAGTQNALVHPIKFLPVLLTLQNLFPRRLRRVLPLQPWLNRLILIVKISHVHHQILDHKHMRQRGNHRRPTRGYFRQTSQTIPAVDVHSARTADSLTAGTAECQC